MTGSPRTGIRANSLTHERIVHWLRIVALAFIVILVAVTVLQASSAGVKAPLLTIMGSGAIIIALFSVSRSAVTAQNIGTILGTVIVMGGGGYWFIDARQQAHADDLTLNTLLIVLLIMVTAIYLLSSMLIPASSIVLTRIRRK